MSSLVFFKLSCFFCEKVLGMKKLVENSVHENSAVSSADCILLETLIDQDTKRSHRAVREAEIIPVDEGSSLFQYMNQIYQGVKVTLCFAKKRKGIM